MADEIEAEKIDVSNAENGGNSEKKKSEFGRTLKSYLNKGVEASRKGIKSAGSAIGEFGDKSVIRLDIAQLKSKLDKELRNLGEAVAAEFSESENVSRESVAEKLKAISDIKEKIGEKESSLKKYEK